MKSVYRILRSLLVFAICATVASPIVIFVALSLPAVQSRLARQCEKELSSLLDCRVTVGDMGIVPFNRAVLRNVTVETAPGDTALTIRRLGAGVRLFSLLSADEPLTVNYVELVGMDARLRRDSAGAALNIQPVIDALSPKDKNKPPTKFDLKINTVMIRSSKLSYDVGPRLETDDDGNRFSPEHLSIEHFRADIRLPRLTNDNFAINIKRLAFAEKHSGFVLDNISGDFVAASDMFSARNLQIVLPQSYLRFTDMGLPLESGMRNVMDALKRSRVKAGLRPGSNLQLEDISAFVPQFGNMPVNVDFERCMFNGNLSAFEVDMKLISDVHASIELTGKGGNLFSPDGRHMSLSKLSLGVDGNELQRLLLQSGVAGEGLPVKLDALGRAGINLKGVLDGVALRGNIDVFSDQGKVSAETSGRFRDFKDFDLAVHVATDGAVDLSGLFPKLDIGEVEGDIVGNVLQKGILTGGSADLEIDHAIFRGASYDAFKAHVTLEDDVLRGYANIDNPNIAFAMEGAYSLRSNDRLVELHLDLDRFIPSMLNLTDKAQGACFGGVADIALEGDRFSHMNGKASVDGLRFTRADGEALVLDSFLLTAEPSRITVRSDFIDGELYGAYDFASIAADFRHIAGMVFPSLLPGSISGKGVGASANDFAFNFTIKETERPARFFNLPVSIVYPVKLSGAFSSQTSDMALNMEAPYLRQGNKLIENTAIAAFMSGEDNIANLDIATAVPTKSGPMKLVFQTKGESDRLFADVSWDIDRAQVYEGNVSVSALFSRDGEGGLCTDVDIAKSSLTFNDSTWTVNPAKIAVSPKHEIRVTGLNVHRSNQYVKIEGNVSDNPWDLLTLDLRNFSLDYLFESLGIDKVMLGGDATGTFYASRLLSSEPVLETPGLSVRGISYNKVVLGDADVRSRWEPETRGITLDATIDSPEGRRSLVNGAIYPLNESLDLVFTADRVNVGFMQPYMEAFASDISGYVSGRARLWGAFKYIDLEGDVFADDLRLKVNFTNTYYTATDSVHFRSGLIDLDGIGIKDAEGHTARLNGWVKHKFFKEPRFEFGVTDAYDFLSYNTTARENPVWYGKIYGNGSAFVKGEPGKVNISVDMSTAPRSTFTFVLSDQEVADEFSFLTFRDKNTLAAGLADTVRLERDTSMDIVNRLRALAQNHDTDTPSDYEISLQMRVTPDARLNLVMDPVGGDRIRANGNGHLRMDYGSANNDLRMYGTYTLDRGNYNFTLQDIIIKDFTIKPGSRITFNGDPYNAGLDIQAAYALNANLSDLDESFLQDKDLNRTNVPVHAILKVAGDLVAPEISFDLEFPTLTTDVYRKVRSIISTDDMMNRQIIYLLALSRFYTPDYMASTTKGNELVSVASSTISSQLSNLLGSISDNWNIAPTFRSDRGDFSDVEVDVALSSRLLNNRLLFNGNFGYRDNSLNTSQFVGDFDLEYLLDRPGMWRLKAYNRYNDQNYYLRTAPTTQGVGVVLKRDFDSFLSFLRPLLRRSKGKSGASVPSVSGISVPADTLSTDIPAERDVAVPHVRPVARPGKQ